MAQDQQPQAQQNHAGNAAEEVNNNPRQFNSELAKVGTCCCNICVTDAD